MAEPTDLNGSVKDQGQIPQEDVNVSVYHKVGEAVTDSNGLYDNVDYTTEFDDYIVEFNKDGFYTIYEDSPQGYVLDAVIQKNDGNTHPDIPTSFRATDFNTGDSIMLTWKASTFEYVAGYNVYRSDDIQERFEKININMIDDLSFLDTNLIPNKDYYYILEVVSANSQSYMQGRTSMTAIVGPSRIASVEAENDITVEAFIRIDSAKSGEEGEKAVDGNAMTWWGSQRGSDAWIEASFDENRQITDVYFRKRTLSTGILFAKLQYFDGVKWQDIQNVDYLQKIEYTFSGFSVYTDKVRIYVIKVEPLSETELTYFKVFGI